MPHELVLPDHLASLSDDAKAIAAAFFPTKGSHVTFHLETKKPTERCQAALDELVTAGTVSRQIINPRGGARYDPLVDLSALSEWSFRRYILDGIDGFTLYEPI